MDTFDPQAYGPVFAPLFDTDRRRPLDAGRPDARAAARAEEALRRNRVRTRPVGVRQLDRPTRHGRRAASRAFGCCTTASTNRTRSARTSTRPPAASGTRSCIAARAISQTPSIGSATSVSIRRSTRSAAAQPRWRQHAARSRSCKSYHARNVGPIRVCGSCARPPSTNNRHPASCCLDIQQAEWELLFDHCYRTLGQWKTSR